MSPRRGLLRFLFRALLIALIWVRLARDWQYISMAWRIGAITVSTLLAGALIFGFIGTSKRWASQKDTVPKNPLGLE